MNVDFLQRRNPAEPKPEGGSSSLVDSPALGPLSPSVLLREIAAATASVADVASVLERVAWLTLRALKAERAYVFLLEDDGRHLGPVTSVARLPERAMAERFLAMEPIDVLEVPLRLELLTQGGAMAIDDVPGSPLIPPSWAEAFDVRSAALGVVASGGEPLGVLGVDHGSSCHPFTPGEVQLLGALASLAGLFVGRHRLGRQIETTLAEQRRLSRLASILERVGRILAANRDPSEALAALAGSGGEGPDAMWVVLSDARLRSSLGAAGPSRAEAGLLARWRRPGAALDPLPLEADLCFPIVAEAKLRGLLRIRSPGGELSPADRALLASLAALLGELALRHSHRRGLADAQRQADLAKERERASGPAYRSLDTTLSRLETGLEDLARRAPESWRRDDLIALATLARLGGDQVRGLAGSRSLLDAGRRGLPAALRDLAERVAAEEPFRAEVAVKGRPRNLSPKAEAVLFRAAETGLNALVRHSRAESVLLHLDYSDGVSLTIRDNGVGLELREGLSNIAVRAPLRDLSRAAEALGGTVDLRDVEPTGAVLRIRLP